MNQQTLTLLLILNLVLIAVVGYWTYNSGWERRRKIMIYILLLVSPVVASLMYLWIQRREEEKGSVK